LAKKLEKLGIPEDRIGYEELEMGSIIRRALIAKTQDKAADIFMKRYQHKGFERKWFMDRIELFLESFKAVVKSEFDVDDEPIYVFGGGSVCHLLLDKLRSIFTDLIVTTPPNSR
jgi:hypothetical protein